MTEKFGQIWKVLKKVGCWDKIQIGLLFMQHSVHGTFFYTTVII